MQAYNDGVLKLYEDVSKRSSFGAKENEAKLQYVCKLNYAEMSQRQKDLEFAEQQGFSLSLKVKTPNCNLIKRRKKFKAFLEDGIYDVSYYDVTAENIFFYLEYIRTRE